MTVWERGLAHYTINKHKKYIKKNNYSLHIKANNLYKYKF